MACKGHWQSFNLPQSAFIFGMDMPCSSAADLRIVTE